MTTEQWNAIKNNDKSYDEVFFYASKTLKTVCRPSCTAKACIPKNIIIFDNLESAIHAGFRPCKKCKPDIQGYSGAKNELAKAAREYIDEHYSEKFSLSHIQSKL